MWNRRSLLGAAVGMLLAALTTFGPRSAQAAGHQETPARPMTER